MKHLIESCLLRPPEDDSKKHCFWRGCVKTGVSEVTVNDTQATVQLCSDHQGKLKVVRDPDCADHEYYYICLKCQEVCAAVFDIDNTSTARPELLCPSR